MMNSRISISGLSRKIGVVVASLLLGSTAMAAQQDASLNQLFRMDVPSKSAQGEGYIGGQVTYFSLKSADLLDIRGYAQYGVMPDITLSLTVPWRKVDIDGSGSESELVDIRIGGQYNLRQMIDPKIAMVAAQVVIALPIADDKKGLDKGEFQLEPSIVAYKSFGEMGGGVLAGYAQVGFNLSSGAHHLILAAAPTYTVYNDWTLVSEFYLACGRITKAGSASDLEWIPGVIYRGLKGFELGLGIPVGVTSDAPDWGIIGKVTWAW